MQTALASSYEEAVQRIEKLQALDTEEISPLSHTSFLTHGHKTKCAILLLHGITNSPRQYVKFAGEYFKRGYNVMVPRFPYHGFQDRMTTALERQTEQELLTFTQNIVDILPGLGEHSTVAGFSMGGILALWVAMHRPDVSLVCSISPALAFQMIPLPLTALVIKAFLWLPNQFWWWDKDLKDKPMPPLHAYPRYSTRAVAHLTNIGLKVRSQARHAMPRAGAVLVITNPTDESVNHAYAREIVDHWQALGAKNLRYYEFDSQLKLRHDLMDPDQPYQQVDVVYPILLDLITAQSLNT